VDSSATFKCKPGLGSHKSAPSPVVCILIGQTLNAEDQRNSRDVTESHQKQRYSACVGQWRVKHTSPLLSSLALSVC